MMGRTEQPYQTLPDSAAVRNLATPLQILQMLLVVAGLLFAQPGMAQDVEPILTEQSIKTRLWTEMRLSELAPIIRDEAMSEAETMQKTMFERGGDGRWLDVVAKIHEPERLEKLLRAGLAKALQGTSQPLIDEALEFYATDLGQRMIGLEMSARQAMLDNAVEEDALAQFAEAASYKKPRVAQISRLIDESDLIEQNVAGGLNAALAFSKGFDAGGGYQTPMTEAQLFEETWKQEPLIRAQALGWLEAFLYLAYSPLSDEEVEEYIAFAGSPAGRELMQVMFSGFDELLSQTSYNMGVAAAGQLEGREL